MVKQKLTLADLKAQAKKYGMKISKSSSIDEVQKFFETKGIIPDEKINGNWDKITGTKEQKDLKLKLLTEQANKPKKKKKTEPKIKTENKPKSKLIEKLENAENHLKGQIKKEIQLLDILDGTEKLKERKKRVKKTQDLLDVMCEAIARGYSLRKICDVYEMPSLTTVSRWVKEDENFREQYTHAREQQADYYADEINEIAENCPPDKDSVAKAKLQIEGKKWISSKLKPRKYGDKLDLGNSDGNLKSTIVVGTLKEKDSLEDVV